MSEEWDKFIHDPRSYSVNDVRQLIINTPLSHLTEDNICHHSYFIDILISDAIDDADYDYINDTNPFDGWSFTTITVTRSSKLITLMKVRAVSITGTPPDHNIMRQINEFYEWIDSIDYENREHNDVYPDKSYGDFFILARRLSDDITIQVQLMVYESYKSTCFDEVNACNILSRIDKDVHDKMYFLIAPVIGKVYGACFTYSKLIMFNKVCYLHYNLYMVLLARGVIV
jgi:hypothetical protein